MQTYRAAHWKGGSATCQGASETVEKKDGITVHRHFAVQ